MKHVSKPTALKRELAAITAARTGALIVKAHQSTVAVINYTEQKTAAAKRWTQTHGALLKSKAVYGSY